MAKKKKKPDATTTEVFAWSYAPRVATDLLGSQKYAQSTRALCELVANALDARAPRVTVTLNENELGAPQSLLVSDDGEGMSVDVLRDRFVVVGIDVPTASDSTSRLGRFGVGRLAVYRIGTLSRWTTTAVQHDGRRLKCSFVLKSDDPAPLRIDCLPVPDDHPTGTTIVIENLRDTGEAALSGGQIRSELLTQFCAYLLANSSQRVIVNGEPLSIESEIEQREPEELPEIPGIATPARIDHLVLKHKAERTRLGGQVLFTSKGRTVAALQPTTPPDPRYLALVACPYLDSVVTSNREALLEMDGGFEALRRAATASMESFGQRLRSRAASSFIVRARAQVFYPYKAIPTDALAQAKRNLYDVVLEKVNEHVNIEGMTQRQQSVIFALLRRVLENQDIHDVLDEVAKLSDDDVAKFRSVLENATLQSLIRMSAELTSRIRFLEVFHEIVYGLPSKRIKERKHLHKILESECWLFDARYHLAASDESFRTIVGRHRELAGLDQEDEGTVEECDPELKKIPDLFLAARRSYPVEPKNHHLVVEIKRPSVQIGTKEKAQIERYAKILSESAEFDKAQTSWDLYLVSARVHPEINFLRNQSGRQKGLMHDLGSIRVWVFAWSEILDRGRAELDLVREHVQLRSNESKVARYLSDKFPEILKQIEAEPSHSTSLAARDAPLDPGT